MSKFAPTLSHDGDRLSDVEAGQVISLARAGCRALRLDEAAAMLRPLAPGPVPPADNKRLRAFARVSEGASFSTLLEALAGRLPSPAAARMAEAAELIQGETHP